MSRNERTRMQENEALRAKLILKMKTGLKEAGFKVGQKYRVSELKQTLLRLGVPYYLFEMVYDACYNRSLFLTKSILLDELLRSVIRQNELPEDDIALRYRVNTETGMIDCYEYDESVILWNRAGRLS